MGIMNWKIVDAEVGTTCIVVITLKTIQLSQQFLLNIFVGLCQEFFSLILRVRTNS